MQTLLHKVLGGGLLGLPQDLQLLVLLGGFEMAKREGGRKLRKWENGGRLEEGAKDVKRVDIYRLEKSLNARMLVGHLYAGLCQARP